MAIRHSFQELSDVVFLFHCFIRDVKVYFQQLRNSCLTESGEEDNKKGTQLLEIIQIDIQMSTIRKDNKKLKQLYEKSKKINSAIPHPLTKGT